VIPRFYEPRPEWPERVERIVDLLGASVRRNRCRGAQWSCGGRTGSGPFTPASDLFAAATAQGLVI
jgi:hypothetical protein